MAGRLISVARSAYQYPLLIKQLLHAPMLQTPDQQIVYRDLRRLTYTDLRDRIGRLANYLKMLGVRPGDTVGVMDWDSHRFLEAFFAIPMMGAILQTVNVRLSPEQVTYTINHAGASVLLVNDEFIGLLQGIKSQLNKVRTFVVLTDRPEPAKGEIEFTGEYEALVCPRACISAIGSSCCIPWRSLRRLEARPSKAASIATTFTCRSRRCSTSTPGDSPGRRRRRA
jgi:fatty-acyl-CoA synthase